MTYADWHIPLSRGELTLREGLDSLTAVGARQQEIPLIVRLLENPKYRLPGMTLFHDAVRLGGTSGCRALNRVDYEQYLDLPLREGRRALGLGADFLAVYYRIEMERYPDSFASQRLLD
jgi:hypothetical protein